MSSARGAPGGGPREGSGGRIAQSIGALFPLEVDGAPASFFLRRIHRVRQLVGVSAIGTAWIMPAPLRMRVGLVVFVVAVYLPWTYAALHVSKRWSPSNAGIAMLAGDLSVVIAVHMSIPATRYVALFGYILISGFYSHLGGRRTGFVVAGVTFVTTLVHEALVRPGLDSYTVAMFTVVLISTVLLVDGVSGAQRATALRLQRLYRALTGLSSSVDVDTVLSTVTREAARSLDADGGVILLRQGDDLVTMGLSYPVQGAVLADNRATISIQAARRWPSVRALLAGRPIFVEDVAAWHGPTEWRSLMLGLGVRAALYQPVVGPSGPVGCLNLWFTRPKRFSDWDRDLLAALGEQASVALERARAYEREHTAAMRLAELSDLQSDFVSTVSHELRTPLTAIEGFAASLEGHWDRIDEDLRRHLVHRIARNGTELHQLIDQLLEFSRSEHALSGREPKDCDVGAWVGRCIEQLERVLATHRVDVEVPPGLSVIADPAGCQRVLKNLLANAAKFSAPGSRIVVRAEPVGAEVLVSVHDEGIGIDPSVQARIFDRFYRVTRGDRSPFGGMGIGLAIVKQIVEAQRGRVGVTSEPGRGSIFTFTLPAAATRSPRAADAIQAS